LHEKFPKLSNDFVSLCGQVASLEDIERQSFTVKQELEWKETHLKIFNILCELKEYEAAEQLLKSLAAFYPDMNDYYIEKFGARMKSEIDSAMTQFEIDNFIKLEKQDCITSFIRRYTSSPSQQSGQDSGQVNTSMPEGLKGALAIYTFYVNDKDYSILIDDIIEEMGEEIEIDNEKENDLIEHEYIVLCVHNKDKNQLFWFVYFAELWLADLV